MLIIVKNYKMDLITKCIDTEHMVLQFVDIKTLLSYASVSKIINNFVKTNNVYKLLQDYMKRCSIDKYYSVLPICRFHYIKNDACLMIWALVNGHNCIYEWLGGIRGLTCGKNNNLGKEITRYVVDAIVVNGHLNSLIYVKKYFPEKINNTHSIISTVGMTGRVDILQ